MWIAPEPACVALPAPLSTQAEIDNLIEVAWETAPEIEPEAPADPHRLPALKPQRPATMEGVMNAEEVREHIAKALREEYDRLFEIIKALQAKGADTSKLQTLAGRVRRALREAERK